MWKYFSVRCSQISDKNSLFETSPACPSDKRGIVTEMSVEHWWNDTDKRKRSTGGGGALSQFHFVDHKYGMAGLESNPVLRGDRPAIQPLRSDTVFLGIQFAYVLYKN
jgi:hypothetical protein